MKSPRDLSRDKRWSQLSPTRLSKKSPIVSNSEKENTPFMNRWRTTAVSLPPAITEHESGNEEEDHSYLIDSLDDEENFNYLDQSGNGFIEFDAIFHELQTAGLRVTDPRIKDILKWKESGEHKITFEVYKSLKLNSRLLLQKSCRRSFRIPHFEEFCKEIENVYSETKMNVKGTTPATFDEYKLNKMQVTDFGVSLCTIDGQRFAVGDAKRCVQLDGCCKPFLYCLAVEQHGSLINDYISHEPSGCDAHALKLKDTNSDLGHIPFNPLMITGALVSCAFIEKDKQDIQDRLANLSSFLEQFFARNNTHRPSVVDNAQNENSAEKSKSSLIKCLGHFLENENCFPVDTKLDEVFELFFRACSTVCTIDELSLMAATLANGGICPITNERFLKAKTVHQCLSVMFSCGMGTYSGEWAFHVGVPATSSISGIIMVVIPGVMGMCTWAPVHDNQKNSVRGVEFFQKVTSRFNFHLFDSLPVINLKKKDPCGYAYGSPTLFQEEMTQMLLSAAAEGDLCEIRRLRSRGANLEASDYDKRTPLHVAAAQGKLSVVKYLLRHIEDTAPEDQWGGTPYTDAVNAGNHFIAQILQGFHKKHLLAETNGVKIDDILCFYAAKKGDLTRIRELESKGANLQARDYDARTPLHLAASEGHYDVVKYLVDAGVNKCCEDKHGQTPTSCAKEGGYRDIVHLLVDAIPADEIKKSEECARAVCAYESDQEDNEEEYEVSLHSAKLLFSSGQKLADDECFRVQTLLNILNDGGLLEDDPRLKIMIDNIRMLGPEAILSYDQYRHITESGAILLEKAIHNALCIPNFQDFCDDISEMFDSTRNECGGNIATYIPQLAAVDPEKYGLSVCTIDGQRFNMGDHRDEFCVQSCSKPISYCLALEEVGFEKVHYHIGCEPSGLRFNELTLLERDTERIPHNPMINSGAIMSSSLIKRHWSHHRKYEYVLNVWTELCGGQKIGFDNSVCLSERSSADRNFCLGYMMREADCLPENTDIMATLEFYFQQCSITMNTEQLSIVAATLANGGVCPITNHRVFSAENVRRCLSLMFSSGMYDYSGSWGFKVGIPAKSGVSGAIMLVIPNVLGVCVWSPRLDTYGNSVRGVRFIETLVDRFAFHHYDMFLDKPSPVYSKNSIENKHGIPRHYLVMYAAQQGNLDALRRLKLNGANLHGFDYDGRSALHIAVLSANMEVVEYLIGQGLNLSAKDRWNRTPLSEAKRASSPEIVHLISKALSCQQ